MNLIDIEMVLYTLINIKKLLRGIKVGLHTTERICSLCNRGFLLEENRGGVVFDDEHFLCEECTKNNPDDELDKFTKTTMNQTGMPICLWLIHEQNKDKIIMSGTRQKQE
jgi:hypothetical protein